MRWLLLFLLGCRGRFDPHAVDSNVHVTYREAVIAAAPVGYYRFGTATPIDEISGTTAVLSGGCTPGAAGALVGDPDHAYAFDGTCRITLPHDFDFPATKPFAIEVWLSTQSDNLFHLPVDREVRGTQDPIDGYALVVAAAGLELERVIASSDTKAGPVPYTQNAYVHVVVQYTGTSSQVYVDGVLGDDVPDTRFANEVTAPTLVGAANPGNFYTGLLDELAIYDRALTAAEIALHHAIGVGG